ncbi:MAG: hypothetical protein GF329_17485 [Candidatus Lokiarchaeota archaeon]|nr:hypothetical protein [Candidatus Lokiarchaeota archaeon]
MKFVDWKKDKVDKFIKKLEELNWHPLPEENTDRFVAAYSYDGNIFKIYSYNDKDLYKVYYDSVPYFHYIQKYDNMNKFTRFLRHFDGKKAVEIDDAGIGCPIGGIAICIYSRYDDLAALKLVSLKYFRKPLFKTKQYQKEVSKRITWAFKQLKINKQNFIRICPGDIFDVAIDDLWNRGFNIITTKADGMAHVLAETRFIEYLRDLGVPDDILDVNPRNIDYANFHRSLNSFLYKNKDFKHRYFKTGWYKD